VSRMQGNAMDILKDFSQKDMIEQITLLEQIKLNPRPEAVDGLLQLYAEPLPDQAVDEMVYHALYEVLAGQAGLVAAILKHPSSRVRILAARRAGADGSPVTLPALLSLLENDSEPDVLVEVIRALGSFREPEVIDRVLRFLQHEEYMVAAWAMRVLAGSGEGKVRDALIDLITRDQELRMEECDLRTVMAVENLAAFRDEQTLDFLIGHLHHPNPAVRKEIIKTVSSHGTLALPALELCMERGRVDEKIMAANVLGLIGGKRSADILVARLQEGTGLDANIKFAIYEALGRIPVMQSIVGLADGLKEKHEMVLLAVVTSIDHVCNFGIVKEIEQLLDRGGKQADRVLRAIVTAHAGKIFAELYRKGVHGEALIHQLLTAGDRKAADVFAGELARIEGDQAARDCKRLLLEGSASAARRILAADDSKAMLYFYRGLANDLGIELITAGDGREALELLEKSGRIDMLITDMNMPNMDGVELVREMRKQAQWAELPILMATTESERSQIDLALRAGVNEFISKPFSSAQLRGRIEATLTDRGIPGNGS
jgi:CheY-like chemotaxis protein